MATDCICWRVDLQVSVGIAEKQAEKEDKSQRAFGPSYPKSKGSAVAQGALELCKVNPSFGKHVIAIAAAGVAVTKAFTKAQTIPKKRMNGCRK